MRRVEVTLAAYAHPSCRAILFRTREAIDEACRGVVALGLEARIEPVLAKSAVLYPATRPIRHAELRAKWAAPGRLRIVFCGRDFEAKDGALALRVVRRLLAAGHDCDFVYVGTIPHIARQSFHDVLTRICFFDSLPRSAVLRLLTGSHVLFHPSPRESVGMVFIEAAATGLAVVGGRGPGLRHLSELLPHGGIQSVDRGHGDPSRHENAFERILQSFVRQPREARSMGLANYRHAIDGPISMRKRNGTLAAVYDAGLRDTAYAPLRTEDLQPGRSWATTRIASRRLDGMIADYRRHMLCTNLQYSYERQRWESSPCHSSCHLVRSVLGVSNRRGDQGAVATARDGRVRRRRAPAWRVGSSHLSSVEVSYAELLQGEVVSPVMWKIKWRILPVDEVRDQPAALAGGHRRNAPWARVSGKLRERWSLSPSL